MADLATAKKLRQERAKIHAEACKIVDAAEKEGRNLRADEKSSYEKMSSDMDELKERIDRLEANSAREDDEDDEDERDEDDEREDDADEEESDDERKVRLKFEERHPGKTLKITRKGKRSRQIPPVGESTFERRAGESNESYSRRKYFASPEYRKVFVDYMRTGKLPAEARALQADSDIAGGYLVAPQQFIGELIRFVNNLVYIRQKATTYTVVGAQSLGVPSLDADPSDSNWTSELSTGNEDSQMAFGKRELFPKPLAKRLKVSSKLLRQAVLDAEALVRERLAYKFAITEEEAFMTGSGANQPLGLFTASNNGIPTSQDVVAGTTTAPTADGIISAFYSVKQQYQDTNEWLFNRTTLKVIRQLKDGIGQYLWQPGMVAGQPDMLYNRPVKSSEYVPGTLTTGLYFGIFADLTKYYIADSETMTLQRLVELYAETNQVGFIARMELDGMPVLAEAYARLKCA